MATTELNPAFMSFNGKMGRIVHYNRLGTQCARTYVKPKNPRTEAQCANRDLFRDAVKSWQLLSPEERDSWNRLARKMKRKVKNGYGLFMSRYMKGSDPAILQVKERIHLASSLYTAGSPLRSDNASAPKVQASSLNTGKATVKKGHEPGS